MYPEHSVMRWDLPNEDLQRTRVRRLCPRSSSRVTASLSEGVGGSQGWGRGGAEQCWPEGWGFSTWGWVGTTHTTWNSRVSEGKPGTQT